MYHAQAYANLVHQGEFFSQRDQSSVIFRDFAGQLYNERLALEAPNVRQRFAQEVEAQLIANVSRVGHRILSLE